ncbi:MAG: 16S rRNA (uracil(1498)-N(3))-methyltransferase [Lachnospiraceae bacterium]|nr:16S rRNA (uracil(1498)-N(3))-methyltransferase [Lachnospiraceae bacterium]
MHHVFFRQEQLSADGKELLIRGEDVHHIVRVLRMKEGEELSASLLSEDGQAQPQREYRFGIEEVSADHVLCRLRFIKEEGRELPARITLLQCLPKSDKMEQIVQKAVELGAAEICPVKAKRCVVRLDERKAGAKVHRWQKIAEAAAAQSKRGNIPQVHEVVSLAEALERTKGFHLKLIPYELAAFDAAGGEGEHCGGMEETRALLDGVKPGETVAVMIGPEGGFEEEEIALAKAAGYRAITLGKRILRTETAGPAVLAYLMLRLEE